MNINLNFSNLEDMTDEKFARLIVRLMAINQIAPIQAPTMQAPSVSRQTVQTVNKGPLENEYNKTFGVALRITSNPVFTGKTREQVAEMCLNAGCIAGMMTRGGIVETSNDESGCTFDGEIEANEGMFD